MNKIINISRKALKANLVPGAILLGFALLLISAYFIYKPLRDVMETVAQAKKAGGFVFSLVSTGFFGGVLPGLLGSYMVKEEKWRKQLASLVFLTLFWAMKGVEIDAFYRLQGLIFGNDPGPAGIIGKILVDQFLYVPLWGGPTMSFAMLFRENNFSLKKTAANFTGNWYINKVLPVVLPNWLVWVPAVAVIYSLKPALQLPVQNIFLCLWSLMLIVISREVNEL